MFLNPYVNNCNNHRVLTSVLSGDLCERDYFVSEASPSPISTYVSFCPQFFTLKLMLPQYKSEAPQTTYSSTAKPQLRVKRTIRRNVCLSSCSVLPSVLKLHRQDGEQNGACVTTLMCNIMCVVNCLPSKGKLMLVQWTTFVHVIHLLVLVSYIMALCMDVDHLKWITACSTKF
jgi:hypothetical protein